MRIGVLLLMMLAWPSLAAVRQYGAGLTDSQWKLDRATRLECRVSHAIPRFGAAHFVSQAGKVTNVAFTLDMRVAATRKGSADLLSVPPRWRPGEMAGNLGAMTLYRQFDGSLQDKVVWQMLSELEKGWQPTFFYRDYLNSRDQVAVALSSVKFRPVYDEFLGCVSQLLPFAFEDIATSVLTYELQSTALTLESKRKLAMITEYLKEDKSVDLLMVDAYADSYGGRWMNQQLSEQRAATIADSLKQAGVEESRILAQGHGEKRHIAPNYTVLDRAKNRRVVVRLSREPSF